SPAKPRCSDSAPEPCPPEPVTPFSLRVTTAMPHSATPSLIGATAAVPHCGTPRPSPYLRGGPSRSRHSPFAPITWLLRCLEVGRDHGRRGITESDDIGVGGSCSHIGAGNDLECGRLVDSRG